MTYNMWACGWSTVTLQSSVLQQQCFSFLSLIVGLFVSLLPSSRCCNLQTVRNQLSYFPPSQQNNFTSHSQDILLLAAANDTTTTLFPNLLLRHICAHDPCPSFFSLRMTEITVISMLGSFINISIL